MWPVYTCICYYFVVCEPLKLRCFSPAYVQAKLDNLSQNDMYTRKLLLDRYKPPEDDPAAADPGAAAPAAAAAAAPQAGTSQHTTRSTDKDEDGPVKKAMGYDEHIRGIVPAKFSKGELLRGPDKEFNLANVQVLARVTAYLYLNGKYDLMSTSKDGSCLFFSVKWGCDMPIEYVTPLMRRDPVVFLAENADYFFPKFEDWIKGGYGGLRLSKEEYEEKSKKGTLTDDEDKAYHDPGPFSYQEYLQYLLKDSTWGDEVLIVCYEHEVANMYHSSP